MCSYEERLGGFVVFDTESFIHKANLIHNLDDIEYIYSQVEYQSTHQDVIIIHTSCGREFLQTPSSHLQGGGCNLCMNKSEDVCRRICEKLTGEKFPRVRPEFLRNPKTGRKLELDCYCEKLKLAVEYNDHAVKMGYQKDEDFAHQKELDKLKQNMCIDQEVTLLYVPLNYTIQNAPIMEKFIRQKFIEAGYESFLLDSKSENSIISSNKKTQDKIILKMKPKVKRNIELKI
jgi:hypothetical protein